MEPPLINSYHLQTVRISRGYPLSGKHLNANDMKLKSRMTVGEMSEHLTEHTGQFYVNPSIKDDGEAETLRTNERENGHERE